MAKSSHDAQTFVPDSETQCCSRWISFNHRHTWTIKDYSLHEEEKMLSSSTFSASGFEAIEWLITLCPRGCNEESKDCVSTFLYLNACPLTSVRVRFVFTLLDAKEQDIKRAGIKDLFTLKVGGDWGFPKFVKRDYVMNRLRELASDELSVRCDMWVAVQTVNTPIEVSPIPSKTSKRRAADILRKFLENQSSKDAASTTPTEGSGVRDEVLRTLSPALKAILERDFATTSSSREEISEMDEDTFMEFVRFIYVDEAEAADSMTKYLLAAIDEYALEKLSSTSASPNALEASPTRPMNEDVSSLVTEDEKLQVRGTAASESHSNPANEIPMPEEEAMVNADLPGEGVGHGPETNHGGSLENHHDIQQEEGHNGGQSGNDSLSSEFSVLEDC